MDLPPDFVGTIQRVFGDAGRDWLARLPGIIARCRERWALRDGVMVSDLRHNYVELASTAAGEEVALKVGVPHPELFTEMEALRLFSGRRSVRFVDASPELGAILMRRIEPGTMLWQVGDNRSQTQIAASLMADLPVAVPDSHGFPTFAQWVVRAFDLTRTQLDPEERMPRDLLERAEHAFREIERSSDEEFVLHGDLHHENILLDAAAGWIAIDPKGVVGPHCLEAGRFLQNQLSSGLSREQRKALLDERLEILSVELAIERETLAASGLVDCVLSHCWAFEGDGELWPEWHLGIELGRAFIQML